MLRIYWKEGYAEDTTDLLPLYWFKDDGRDGFRQHVIRGAHDPQVYARCSVSVDGRIVELDYGGEHREYNEAQRYIIGVTRLTFDDETRAGIPGVEWKAQSSQQFDDENSNVTVTRRKVRSRGALPFDPKNRSDGRTMIKRLVAVRQGQSIFRDELMSAYGAQCAITGCRVEEVLQAAHIMPYLGTHTDHVTNGMLLRADIHTLFDLNVVKIDGDYRISAPSSIIKAFDLPDRLTNLPKNDADWPSPDALWEKSVTLIKPVS